MGVSEISILEEVYGGEKYDLITGVSVGAINGFYLSHFENMTKGIENMKLIWSKIRSNMVYNQSYLDPIKLWSIYDNSPLYDLFDQILGGLPQTDFKIPTIIGATNLNHNVLDKFHIHNYNENDIKDLLVASSSIPVAFPPKVINGTYYVDGGYITNELLYNIENYFNGCSEYNITFILTDKPTKNITIDGFESYVDTLLKGMLKNFDLQLLELEGFPQGNIILHYISKPDNITLLNFDYPDYLYQYSKNFSTLIF